MTERVERHISVITVLTKCRLWEPQHVVIPLHTLSHKFSYILVPFDLHLGVASCILYSYFFFGGGGRLIYFSLPLCATFSFHLFVLVLYVLTILIPSGRAMKDVGLRPLAR
jgi:hypothetical protein